MENLSQWLLLESSAKFCWIKTSKSSLQSPFSCLIFSYIYSIQSIYNFKIPDWAMSFLQGVLGSKKKPHFRLDWHHTSRLFASNSVYNNDLVCKASSVASNQARWFLRILREGYSVPRVFSWNENCTLNYLRKIFILMSDCIR